jgi:ribulose-phosphate 3-epimerase
MILAPSILASDLGHLADQLGAVERGGAGLVHVDVMDGRFVPNISLGPVVVEACRRATSLPVDVHLMIESAERYLDAFVDAGASSISVHVEALPHLQRAIDHLRKRGVRGGVALNPSTPLGALEEILPEVDFVLVMSVNPGFAGQKLLPSSLDKLRRLREAIRARGLSARIQVDGGVHLGNIRAVVESGAEIVVAGAAAFAGGDPEAAVRSLVAAAGPLA